MGPMCDGPRPTRDAPPALLRRSGRAGARNRGRQLVNAPRRARRGATPSHMRRPRTYGAVAERVPLLQQTHARMRGRAEVHGTRSVAPARRVVARGGPIGP